jgi:hypothetical protein
MGEFNNPPPRIKISLGLELKSRIIGDSDLDGAHRHLFNASNVASARRECPPITSTSFNLAVRCYDCFDINFTLPPTMHKPTFVFGSVHEKGAVGN